MRKPETDAMAQKLTGENTYLPNQHDNMTRSMDQNPLTSPISWSLGGCLKYTYSVCPIIDPSSDDLQAGGVFRIYFQADLCAQN